MSMKPPIGQNLTDLIKRLNHERMLFQLPVVVVLVVIMAISLMGNSMVVCVYKSKYKKRTSSFFIMILAIVDLSSSLCIPYTVFDLVNPFMHPTPIICKINRFTEALTTTSSGFVLLCIAFDRFFHVCYPLRIYSINQARSLTIVMLTMAVCLAWPMLFLAGKKTMPTPVPGVFGEDCSYRDGMNNSIYTLLFQSGLFFAFFVTFCVAFVFYCKIFYVIIKRKRTTIGEQCYSLKEETSVSKSSSNSPRKLVNSPSNITETNEHVKMNQTTECNKQSSNGSDSINSVFTDDCDEGKSKSHPVSQVNENVEMNQTSESCNHLTNGFENTSFVVDDDSDQTNSKSLPVLQTITGKRPSKTTSKVFQNRSEKRTSRMSKTQIRTTRTTIILALVTLSTLVGFMPYLAVSLMINFGKYFQPGMPIGEDLTYEFCSKSYFLNCAVNPIIYSVMNPVFRREGVAILKKIANVFHRK